MLLGAIPLMALGAGAPSLLANRGFDDGLAGWQMNPGAARIEAVRIADRSAARIVVPDGAAVGFPCLYQEIPAGPGDLLQAGVEASRKNVREGYGAYAAIEFYDAEAKRLSATSSNAAPFEGQWTELKVRALAPPGTVKARLCLLLNGRGEARFDNATLVRLPVIAPKALGGPVTLTVTGKVVCDSLIGFGAEDDGWFYGPENMAHGITAEDIALREGRIEWMHPSWVRMFFWHKDWCPSGDWETFTFDSPNMQSHYRTLDLYQRLGARVNVTGVEWGMPDAYRQPERFARAVGALFEHLIRTKGYTCVQDWTLTNEPNGSFAPLGYSFEQFVELHRLVKQEFERRGLAVNVVGSDDTGSPEWFAHCVKDDTYFRTAGLFSSHGYLRDTSRFLVPYFFADRLAALQSRSPIKPFVVGEFGFQDARSGTFANPLMKTYPYAIWTAAFVIEGLNQGAAGFSIWCLHEVQYPGSEMMNYGLWDFKDDGWKTRPVYYAWADFCRLTRAGDKVRQCLSSHPGNVTGAVVGNTLFWVNEGSEPATVQLSGFPAAQVRILTEATLTGDRECGVVEPIAGGRFTAPPQSFGYAR